MQTQTSLSFTAAAVTDRGLSEKRPHNEDSYLEQSDIGLFAVADGVGGAQAGDVASQMAVEILAEAFNNQPPNADAEEVMKIALERANAAIFQMANDLPQLASMATTIVALQISSNIATIGHVGDSRLYRFDPRGGLHRETADHSVVEEEVRAGRMTQAQALNHPSRNVISRALGAEDSVEVELRTIMIEPGTLFLLCSDGITRHIPDHELEEMFVANTEPEILTRRLKETCYSRGAEDNLTAVIVRIASAVGEEDLPESALPPAFQKDVPKIEDFDEDTVATARTEPIVVAHPENAETFEDLTAEDEELDDESYLSDELSAFGRPPATDTSNYTSSSVVVPPTVLPPASQSRPAFEPSFNVATAKSSSVLTRVLTSLLLIGAGVVMGAGAYYMLTPAPVEQPQPAPALVEKSSDISLTGFEESRRLIDKDPAAYINANAASPQVPEDYFLLGRAFLLTGKYWEAKRAFAEARNRLSQADPTNAKTLATEIAMVLALIETPGATEAFAKENAVQAPTPNANTNAIAAPGRVPLR